MPFESDGQNIAKTLIEAPQAVTPAWAKLGGEFLLWKMKHLLLWIERTHNDSSDIRVRLVPKRGYGASSPDYQPQIESTGATIVKLNPEGKEFDIDATQEPIVSYDLDGCVPVGQFEIMAGAVGSSADVIETAHITASM